MLFTHTVEISIRLSQRQTAEFIAQELSLPLEQIRRVELIIRYLSGRNCDAFCNELGLAEEQVDKLCDEFLKAKYLELMKIPADQISDHQRKNLEHLVDVDRGRASIDPKDSELESLVQQLFAAETTVKNRVLKALAEKDERLHEKLQKRKEDDQLMALAMKESTENFDDLPQYQPRTKRQSKSSRGGDSSDRYALLRENRTNGDNYNLQTNQIIQQLENWRTFSNFEIAGAGHDWVELRFSRLPKDLFEFAKSIYEFCPDTVDQGFMSQEALIEDLAHSKTLKLWWD